MSPRLPPVLVVNTNLPVFPGTGGVEALMLQQLASLSDAVGLVAMAHSRADLAGAQPLRAAGVQLYLWESPNCSPSATPAAPAPEGGASLRERWAPTLQRWVDGARAGSQRPIDTFVVERGLKNLSPHLFAALGERDWPIVAVVESSAAAFLDALPPGALKVLVMHDVRALLYERRAASASSDALRRAAATEAVRYRDFEGRYVPRYDLVTTVSEHDAAWVRENYRPQRVITVPLPVDAVYFAPEARPEVPGRIVFPGQMNHPPNADAAEFLAREVLPLVCAQVPQAHVQIVGRNPLPEVLALGALPGVTVTGGVDDVRPYLGAAQVIAVPLRYGSGARQKILEAWALERCVVATPLGAEGLDAQDGENVLLGSGAQGLAAQLVRALTDGALREHVRRAGRGIVLRQHDPRRVAADYAAELRRAYDERQAQLGRQPLAALLDLRWLTVAGDTPRERQARALLLALSHHRFDPDARLTVLMRTTTARALWAPGTAGLRLLCEDGLRSRWVAGAERAWQAVRGLLGIFRDVSPELLTLRRLARLNTRVCLSVGTIADDLRLLRQVVVGSDANIDLETLLADLLAAQRSPSPPPHSRRERSDG